MSLQIFCFSCGSPTLYTIAKPNFCAKCGKSFDESVASLPKSNIIQFETTQERQIPSSTVKSPNRVLKRPARFARMEDQEDDNEDDDFEVPNISGLDFEIEGEPDKGIKIGSLLKGAEAPLGIKRPKAKKVSKKEILEQLKKEGGSGRREATEVGE